MANSGLAELQASMAQPMHFVAPEQKMDKYLPADEAESPTEAADSAPPTFNEEDFEARPIPKSKELLDELGVKSESASDQTLSPEKLQRNRVGIRNAVKVYDKVQAGLFTYLYDWMGNTQKARKRNKALRNRVGSLTEEEQAEFKALGDALDSIEDQRMDFIQAIRMDEESIQVLCDCAADVFEVEGIEMSPWTILIIIIGGQLLANSVLLWTHLQSQKKPK